MDSYFNSKEKQGATNVDEYDYKSWINYYRKAAPNQCGCMMNSKDMCYGYSANYFVLTQPMFQRLVAWSMLQEFHVNQIMIRGLQF